MNQASMLREIFSLRHLNLKHTATLVVLFLACASFALAQAPPYYNFDSTGGGNSFPFNVAAGKEVQWLVAPGEINRPSPVPGGQNITAIYFRANTSASPTFTNVTVKLGQTTITSLPIGVVYTGPLTQVYFRASLNITSTAQGWISLTLDTPFLYDPTQSLVIDVQQCGMTGTGFTVNQRTYGTTGTPRRTYLTTAACPQTYSGQDGTLAAFGVAVTPAAPPGWNAQTSGVTTVLNSVKAVGPSIAWAVGNGGVVRRTTDGGTTWTGVGGGNIGTQDLYAVDAISASTAFVTGTPGTTTYMFRTTNGGTSWDTVFTQAGGFLDAIHMYDATNGIAMGDPVGGKWVILKTTDGGATWARIATEPTQVSGEAGSNNGLATFGTTHLWFCSNSTPPKIYRSTDAGATWASSNLPGTATFTAGIAFNSTQYGVTGGNNGNAARTTDGGATWTAITVGTSGAIYGAASAGQLNFWTSRGTTVQRSRDRGVTFTQEFTDATAGTFYHMSVVTSGTSVFGWGVTSTGKIYGYFNPVDIHDLGVSSLAKVFSTGDQPGSGNVQPSDAKSWESSPETIANVGAERVDGVVDDQVNGGLALYPLRGASFDLADTAGFRAIVKNFGTFTESSYQLGWQINGANQTTISRGSIAAGANDTLTFQWNQAFNGVHTLRAWTILAAENNPANDTATLSFSVGRVQGDTLANWTVPNSHLILGVAKIPTNKLVITSGGQSNAIATDNKYLVMTLRGAFLDTTHFEIGATNGFGFRDLAWDGRWLLTSEDTRIRRIDTATFTEILAPITSSANNPHRGIASAGPNRIYTSNFTTGPVVLLDTTGATVKSLGIPTVAPYGLAWDKWTSRSKAYLWYAQPSTAGQIKLSKVDTSNGAILATYNYSTMFPATASSGGLDIVNDHPDYPGSVVAIMATQFGPGGAITTIFLGRDSSTVGVDEQTQLPDKYALSQNYPNPFNPSTTIHYALPTESHVTLGVYNLLGQHVAQLRNEVQGAGSYEAVWNGTNSAGKPLASGVYFYRLDAKPVNGSAFSSLKKMILLK